MPNSTSNSPAWLLQQLGITQFELRRPAVLQGEVAVSIHQNLRLMIISPQALRLSAPLIQDIMLSMQLTAEQVNWVSTERAVMLPSNIAACLWFMGSEIPESLQNNPAPKLITVSFDQLSQDAQAKRQLWQMICQHEHYFTTYRS